MVLDLGGRGNDTFVLALTLVMGGFLAMTGPSLAWDWSGVRQFDARTEIAVTLANTAMGIVALWIAARTACRLRSAAPDAVIGESGLALKPCMAPHPIEWSGITGSRLRADRYRGRVDWVLELDLAAPIRSLSSGYLPSRTVRLASRSKSQMQDAARLVRHYRMLAGHPR
jgi:hypothetical protein